MSAQGAPERRVHVDSQNKMVVVWWVAGRHLHRLCYDPDHHESREDRAALTDPTATIPPDARTCLHYRPSLPSCGALTMLSGWAYGVRPELYDLVLSTPVTDCRAGRTR